MKEFLISPRRGLVFQGKKFKSRNDRSKYNRNRTDAGRRDEGLPLEKSTFEQQKEKLHVEVRDMGADTEWCYRDNRILLGIMEEFLKFL